MPKMTVDYEDNALMWKCPGCQLTHVVYFDRQKSPCWQWNHNVESPTITPSVRARWSYGNPPQDRICHFFITNGTIQFLSDCTHAYSGMFVDMIPI